MLNSLVLEVLKDFDISIYSPLHPRALSLGEPLAPRAGNLVKVVGGMRRSGKSYRLFQEMYALHEDGVPWERICYFNFEDDRLSPVTPQTGDAVLEAFQSLHPHAFEEGAFLFFDELQEMEGWGAWLRRIVDTKRVTIYVTGSSSKMLSSEIATEFRGRALDFELLPLSFAESLEFNGIPAPRGPGYSSAERIALARAFDSYLRQGGFPAAQGLPFQEAVPLLQSYAQRVVARDVIERHGVARPRVATSFAQRLLGLNGRQLSARKVANDLRSAGIPTSRELLGDLLGYLEEAYLLFTVRNRAFSLAESTNSTPKVYAVDPGLALANGRANTNDAGQRLEDAVYLELRRRAIGMRKGTITSLRTSAHDCEIDFALGDALDERPLGLIQVCADVADDATFDRESRALWEALDEQGLQEGVLVIGTGDEAVHERGGRTIRQVPAWKWFLEG